MPLNVIIKELVEGLPSQVKSHYFSRSKKEKSIAMVLDHAKEQLKPVVHTLWNELEVKEQEVRAFISQKLNAGISQEKVFEEIKTKGDPDQVTLFQLVFEEVKKQVEDEKFFIFKEIGERIADREIWNQVHARISPDDRIMATVSGSLKSEYLVKTVKQVVIIKKGISSLLKGSLQMSIHAIPLDQVLDVAIGSSMIGATMSLKYLSGSTDFKYKKDYQTEMEAIVLQIKERMKKREDVNKPTPGDSSEIPAGSSEAATSSETAQTQDHVSQEGSEPVGNGTPSLSEETPEIQQSVCPNCFKPVEPDARFCGNCGASLQKTLPVEETRAYQSESEDPVDTVNPEDPKDPDHQG